MEETPRNNLLHTEQNYSIGNHPTSSEFGNISEIMDINRQFNNTLNTKDNQSNTQNNNILGFLLESSAGDTSVGKSDQIVQ